MCLFELYNATGQYTILFNVKLMNKIRFSLRLQRKELINFIINFTLQSKKKRKKKSIRKIYKLSMSVSLAIAKKEVQFFFFKFRFLLSLKNAE